ncbi:MAG: DNA mismatch repair endonuclease MutL [Streptococcaceae bacterium]|nr:DNA mismatch repair endonuclease MutL [Streptococcaceae bacterium]
MGRIVELDQSLANQIAAGEVVERPASVVKELVENSIDAGATKITVKVQEAGLESIQVIDNGLGIESEDVELSLKRHATSKIKSSQDLFRIRTLGFRGEAMPSIASVSEFIIETSTESEEAGTKLFAKGGAIESVQPIAKIQGTKITVSNLFYNTPARLKFVKSLQAELSHITDLVNRLSLAHPEISFELINEGNQLLKTAGNGDLQQVIASIYGVASAKKMRKIHNEDLDFQIDGYVSLPELTRANRNYITLLINGRYIKNFLLNRAIIEGYGSKLMVGRFPLAVISIEIDPHLADVNVHPTKQEVRLSKEKELMTLVSQAIAEALEDEVLIPGALENLQGRAEEKQVKAKEESTQTKLPLQENSLYYDKEKADFFIKEENKTKEIQVKESPVYENEIKESLEAETEESEQSIKVFPQLEFLAQMHATYLLCQSPDGLYIVDQHAAQERFKYEYWREHIGQVSMDQQTLLTPYIFTLAKDDFIRVAEQKDLLNQAGVNLEEYGDNQFILREHPLWMKDEEIESAVNELMDLLLSGQEVSVAKYREDLAIMIACKSSIKANHPLDNQSAKALLEDLATCKNPYNCPHGRPVLVHFTSSDMEKMFRRIQESHSSKNMIWKNNI